GAFDRIHQLIEKRALTLQKLRPRRINGEPVHPVDLGILPDVPRSLGPLQREGVADRAVEVEVAAHRVSGDDLSARLPQRREVDAGAVGGWLAQFLLEFAPRGRPGILALGVLALRDRPRPVVFFRPEWPARMPYQDFDVRFGNPIQEETRAEFRH